MDTSTQQPTEHTSSLSIPPTSTPWYRDKAIWFGAVGVLCFSFTLPATRIADPAFGSIVVGLGRAIIAAILAGAGHLQAGDIWMLLAVVAAAIGYTEG
jgi:hypothetical protein